VLAQLTALGLADRTENLPCELSVGQQQRVAVARTLVNDPVLLLADEPTGDVDPETAQEIIAQLLRPVKERGAALLIATHGTFPLEYADRIYDLHDGVVTERIAVS
jgi:putative ABC transport system ATP-binding protein